MSKSNKEFLGLFDVNLVEEVTRESIEERAKNRMKKDAYNARLQQQANRDILFNIPVKIMEKDEKKMKKDKVKTKNTGWELFDIDVKAVEDFIYNRDYNMQEVLMYALRYYIPKAIYDDIINRNKDIEKGIIDISDEKVKEFKEKFGNINDYHLMISYKPVYNSNEFNNMTSKPSWKIPYMDYLALVDYKRIFGITYQSIVINALRFYLLEQNYNHAEELIRLLEKHKEENIEMYRGNVNEKSK